MKKVTGIIIRTDNSVEIRDVLDEGVTYQAIVGGWLEAIGVDDATMYINEEGKLLSLPPNLIATGIAHSSRGISQRDFISGNVLLVGPPDMMGNDTDVPESWQEWARNQQ